METNRLRGAVVVDETELQIVHGVSDVQVVKGRERCANIVGQMIRAGLTNILVAKAGANVSAVQDGGSRRIVMDIGLSFG